jgi:hypothetical protein
MLHGLCFGEYQGRIIVATKNPEKVILSAKNNLVDFFVLGDTNKTGNLNLYNLAPISINDISNYNEETLPLLMNEDK